MQRGGVCTEGGVRTEARADTMKRPQGGKEIHNGKVLAKWEKNGGVRVQEVFKNKFARMFCTVLGV